MTVGTNADGRLELFESQRTGELRHRWQRESLHDWSAWSGLGGFFYPGIAVVNDAAGRLAVFAVDLHSHTVMYNFQTASNSPFWSSWNSLPGPAVRGPLAAGQDAEGRIEVFAVAADSGALKRIEQKESGQGWGQWADMGGAFASGLVVARDKSGALEVFAIHRGDQILFHSWQAPGEVSNDWSPWSSLEEPILPGFVVAQNKDERLEVIGVNATNGLVVHAAQRSAGADADWSAWASLGVKMRPGIAAGRCRDGRIEIFTVSPSNNMIYHAFQNRAGAGNWGMWTDMSLVGGLDIARPAEAMTNQPRWADVGGRTKSYPVIAKNLEGTLEIFAFDDRLEDVLNHRRQITGVLNWTDWLNLDASSVQYMSRAWRMDEGLPDNRVQAIAQTPDGYIWVGTRKGLARFDGAQFVRCDVKTMFDTVNPSITCLYASRDGILWIGSEQEGLSRLTYGQATRYTRQDGLAGDRVTVILESHDRTLWIGTTTGLSRFRDGKFVNYTRKDGLASDNIRSALEDSEGNLWVTTDHGLSCLKGKRITTYTDKNGLPDNSLTGIWQDVPGRLWLGSDHGLILFRGNGFHSYDWRYGLSDRLASAIRSDSEGNLWLGNNGGLDQFKEGRFFEEFDQEGNPFGKVNALFNDREGNLWAGSQEGLFRLTPKRLAVYGRHEQLTHDNTTSVLEDNAGSLWLGTWGGGLDQWKDETVAAFGPSNGFHFDLISALCKGPDDNLWVAGGWTGSGIMQLKYDGIAFPASQIELPGVAVKVLHEDVAGRLWIGGDVGLFCRNAGRFVTNGATGQLQGRFVRAICEDSNGTLWFGGKDGLTRWQNSQITQFTTKNGLSDNSVSALYLDEAHDLWIGTQNGGLNRFKNGHITHYTASHGLFSDEIFEVLEDDFGWLWMSCSKGVFRVRKQNLDDIDGRQTGFVTSIAYGRDDGMTSVLCGNGKPGAWKTHDGRLWFPTGKGLVAFDPRALKVNGNPPPVYIEELVVDKHSVADQNGLASLLPGASVRIPPGWSEMEFHYTAPSFQTPEKIRFKYKLEGVDADWIDADTRRVAYYNNLSPGQYTFWVKACNSDGVWNEAGDTLSVRLVPHFWQTWWFRLLAISAIVTAVAGTARQVTRRKMQRKMELLEQRHAVEKERLRIAQDIHDDLGGSLTQIALLGELAIGSLGNPAQAARHLSKITNSARLNVRALDEIVWAVHPGHDTLNSLVLYLWQFAEEFFGPTKVRCRVDAPNDIPSHPLSSDLRHAIFLVVKEAFNNTVKHAQASEVRLRFATLNSNFVVAIEDNGIGFSAAAVNGAGNGLANMKRRIEEFGGKITWSGGQGSGTRVEFVLPLKENHAVN